MCQFKYVNEIAAEDSWLDDKLEILRKKMLYVRWRVNRLRDRFARRYLATKPEVFSDPPVSPGEIVRVRPKREIQGMLDDRRKYKGLGFLLEQFSLCGSTQMVLKEVNYFYDEVMEKQVKCKNLVFLEDCHCSGIIPFLSSQCDLNCLLFWHKDWLVRKENKDI
ncbi:MAG: hypothetical protein QME75_00460 [Deltaproteobacteria bacterium]|nr:hypothetical protein [Deltaproteobacteria bacterium]